MFREQFLSRTKQKEYISIEEARSKKYKINWEQTTIVKPKKLGIQVIQEFDITKLEEFIDWSPFFRSWDLHGKYPNILTDEVVGEQATELFKDAQELLQRIFSEKLLGAKAIFGLFPANTINDDDIEIYDENGDIQHTFLTFVSNSKNERKFPISHCLILLPRSQLGKPIIWVVFV